MAAGWLSLAVGAVGALGSISSANDANDTNNRSIDAQESAAKKQAALAQDQWDFQKSTYLPKQMANADSQLAMSKQLTDQQLKNSDYQMGLSQEQNAQAKKSYEFQDQYDQTARDYSSGNVGNVEANKDLAAKRALGALQYLESAGIPKQRMRTIPGDITGETRVTFGVGEIPY